MFSLLARYIRIPALVAMIVGFLSIIHLCGFGTNDRLRTIDVWTSTGTVGTTLSYVAMPPVAGGRYRVQYVNATSDLSSAQLILGVAGAPVVLTADSASGQAVINAPGTGNFSANDIVLTHHIATGQMDRLVVTSVATATVTMTGNLTVSLSAGDKIYKVTDGAQILVGAATKELNATAAQIFISQAGRPLYLRLPGTSACRINTGSGDIIAP